MTKHESSEIPLPSKASLVNQTQLSAVLDLVHETTSKASIVGHNTTGYGPLSPVQYNGSLY